MYLKDCNNSIVRNTTITEGRNGLILLNCNDGVLYNNTIQFNSGTGMSLFESNNNQIIHNRLDWNVRKNTIFKEIGNDAGAIIISTNSSKNKIAYNSTTHCTNGISILSSSQSYTNKKNGSNKNIIYGNDCSRTLNNGIRMKYSSNMIFNNIINDAGIGINCTFSNRSMIMGNAIENNKTGIYLSNVQNFQIRHNQLFGNSTALMTDFTKHVDEHSNSNNVFSKLNDKISIDHNSFRHNSLMFNINHSKLVKIVLNQFVNSYLSQKGNNNENLILKSNEEFTKTVKKIDDSAFIAYAPRALRDGMNTKSITAEQGKEYILMNEYGTYSFRYPKLLLRSKIETKGEYLFTFFGPRGNFKLKKGINVKEINLETGTIPSTLVVRKDDLSKPISLQIEFIGESIETQFGEKYKKGEPFLVEWKD